MSGITKSGKVAQKEFCRISGWENLENSSEGDARNPEDSLQIVEIKQVASAIGTVNQVRPIRKLPLIIRDSVKDLWFVVPVTNQIMFASDRKGQHQVGAFNNLTLNTAFLNKRGFSVSTGGLKESIQSAFQKDKQNTLLLVKMDSLLAESKELEKKWKEEVIQYVRDNLSG